MRFGLTRPCARCPFRNDITPYLTPERVRDIADALRSDLTFSCHATNDFDDEGRTIETERSHHCAGALIVCEREGFAGQLARIAMRLGLYDPDKLDMSSPVYDDLDDWVDAVESWCVEMIDIPA